MPARALGAPHTTCTGLARAGIDHADAQPVGVRMLLGGDHARDDEGRERLAVVVDGLDLKADHGQLVDDRLERRVGVEMLLQPGEGEFHRVAPLRASQGLAACACLLPPPLAGEGWGEDMLDSRSDCLQHALAICHDVVIVKAQDAKSF